MNDNPRKAIEINFDGIVGPSHNYAGLSQGNLASQKHALSKSNPRQAALQGLAKMKFLHDLGLRQAVLPPHPRPNLAALRRLGFTGNDADVLQQAHRHDPRLIAAAYSASAMWAANAATVSASRDATDARVHFTPANLITQFHRSLEPPFTSAILRQIFPGTEHFAHHDPLPTADAFADEGAADHMRLCADHGSTGIEIFVFGRDAQRADRPATRFPARQTRQAAEAIARLHCLDPARVVFARQSSAAIDAGVFHNDVIAVGNEDVLLCHAGAWDEAEKTIGEIRESFTALTGREPKIFVAHPDDLSLNDAVASYIFNSQLVTMSDGAMSLIAPIECRDHPAVQNFLARVLDAQSPIRSIHYLDVRQSMKNGGGPACLRLRVVLTPDELSQVHAGVLFDQKLYDSLVACVNRRYRDCLATADLADPAFMRECADALDELLHLLQLTG